MAYRIRVFPAAEQDADAIYCYLAKRSPAGAARWWQALQSALVEAAAAPEQCSRLADFDSSGCDVRQFLFKTPRGRYYRGVFVIVEQELRLLRVRGPGQPPLAPHETIGQ
ncbi:MAG: type II toxin-antitoxin system RelE/ParE family toxin [Planctomycetales bacterium]|nr:type II toxin-antitoxin system RelE/ParE family toxin [Planctomycetales bacterium]